MHEVAIVQTIVDTIKRENFTPGYQATDAEAFGLLMARYFSHDARILASAARALEDANFHTESGQVAEMYAKYEQADDAELIDANTRRAVFATLREHFPSISRDSRLRKLSVLAGRPADDPIVSLSDRYGNMTNGDARRFFDVIKEMSTP